MPRRRLVALAVASLVLGVPVAALGADAPGRVAFGVAKTVPVTNVDAGGATVGAAVPGGGAILVGDDGSRLALAELDAAGHLVPAFGELGVARPAAPARFGVEQVLRRPDGRLLLVGTTTPPTRLDLPRLAVLGLTSRGAPDPGFGDGGVAQLSVQGYCANCEPAALAPDGSLLVTGTLTQALAPDPPSPTGPGADRRWVVTRLTPAGAADATFGDAGVATLPGATGEAGGFAVGIGAGARVLTFGSAGPGGRQLRGLTPTGATDLAYHGGAPVAVATPFALHTLVRPSGVVDVVGTDRVTRFTPGGELDTAFGDGGSAALPPISGGFTPRALPTPDGGLLVASPPSYEIHAASVPTARLLRLGPDGRPGLSADLSPGFGGGLASFTRSTRLPTDTLNQDSFLTSALLARPNGGALLVGGERVVRYTGEGEGVSAGLFAATAVTSALQPDPAYGGAQVTPTLSVAVPAQHARSDVSLKRILVRGRASAPGLLLLRVRDGRRHVLAQSVEPVFAAGSFTARVPLTTLGRSILRHGGRRVLVGRAFRDVLTGTADGSSPARLR
jgi:Domain of unknown function (DUF5122) beta-propeller